MVIRKYNYFVSNKKDIKIAVISDVHGNFINEIEDSLRNEKPDYIAIVGDLVDEKYPLNDECLKKLRRYVSLAPVYMSLGNHDYFLNGDNCEALNKAGVLILDDNYIELRKGIFVGGLTSAYVTRYRQFGNKSKKTVLSNLSFLKKFSDLRGFKILLDHHPENYELYTKNLDIDLILSGHFHGGQIAIKDRGLYVPGHGFFPKYTGGFYDNKLVVSRGLSNTSFIPRIGNPVELVYISI